MGSRLRRPASLLIGALPVIAFLSVAVASAQPDEASAEREAFVALGAKDGSCLKGGQAYVLRPDPGLVDAALPVGHGWMNGAFVGSAAELAKDRNGTIVSSSPKSTWILTEGEGSTIVTEWRWFPLPSGRVAWIFDNSAQLSGCD